MRRWRRTPRRAMPAKRRLLIAGSLIVLVLTLAVILIDHQIRPMLQLYGNNQATTAATLAVNNAVAVVLQETAFAYEDLSAVNKDAEGNIQSVETNTGNLNTLKALLSARILSELDRQENQTVSVPLGSLFGGGLLTGRGPRITIRVPMNATVETTFDSQFEGAGINQTRHRIEVQVKVTVYAVMSDNAEPIEVNTLVTVAETILLGEIPQWYLQH